MKAYKVVAENTHEYQGTLKEAHKAAKEYVAQGDDWRDIEIHEVEIPTDKESLLFRFNGYGRETKIRSWGFKSERLGLEEVGKND